MRSVEMGGDPLNPLGLVRVVITVKIGKDLGEMDFESEVMHPIVAEVLLADLKETRVVRARKVKLGESVRWP